MDLCQTFNGVSDHKFVLQEQSAVSFSRDVDSFGNRDLLIPRQHGNFAHLAEIHSNRIGIDFRRVLGSERSVRVVLRRRLDLSGCCHVVDVRVNVKIALLDTHQQVIELLRADCLIRKVCHNRGDGDMAIPETIFDQFVELNIESVHSRSLIAFKIVCKSSAA